jgi:hypothetical protein
LRAFSLQNLPDQPGCITGKAGTGPKPFSFPEGLYLIEIPPVHPDDFPASAID